MESSSAQSPPTRGDGAIEQRAAGWVAAGLIDAAQASAIVHFERDRLDTGPPDRFTPLTEAAAYAGCVLALMGGATVVAPNWNDLALGGQLAVSIAVALVGFTAGTWMMHLGEDSTMRLGSFLWVVGTGGLVMVATAVLGEIDVDDEAWTVVAIGIVITAAGLLLWLNLDRPLQLLTAACGVGITSGGVLDLSDPPQAVGGVWFIVIGAACGTAATLHRLTPRLVALVVGSFSTYSGAFMLMEVNEHLGAALALAVALTVVALALREHLIPLLVLGVIGSLIATQVLLQSTFTGPTSAAIVALLGLAIVAVAVVNSQRGADTPAP